MKIETIDLNLLGNKKAIASFLVVGNGRPVLVESGPHSTTPVLVAALEEHGYEPSDIEAVLLTHIHLDHAGAAGWWSRQGAKIYVHPVGAPHLIDNSRLLRSALRSFGDDLARLWGDMPEADPEMVIPIADREVIEVAGLRFLALDTPGHAGHHHSYKIEDAIFTGDVAGVVIEGLTLRELSAPPPEFQPQLWRKSLEAIESESPSTLYLTHFGRVDDPKMHLEKFRSVFEHCAEFVRVRNSEGMERDTILREYAGWRRKHAKTHGVEGSWFNSYQIMNPDHLTVDGILRYFRKRS